MLAATKPGTGVVLWDVASKTIRRDVTVTGTVRDGVFDREGKHLAVTSFRPGPPVAWRLTMFQVSGEEEPITINFDHQHPFNLAFSEDARELSLIARDYSTIPSPEAHLEFRSWEVASGKELASRKWDLPHQDFFQFSPDRKTLLSGSRKKPDVTIWDVSTGQSVAKLSATGAPVSNPCFIMPFVDVKTAGICRQDGTMELWDLDSRTLRKTFRGHTNNFSPHRMLCSTDSDLMVSEAMEHLNTSSLMRKAEYIISWLLRKNNPGYDPSETMLWDSRTGRVRGRIPNEIRAVLSNDGKRLATTSSARVIRVWDLVPH